MCGLCIMVVISEFWTYWSNRSYLWVLFLFWLLGLLSTSCRTRLADRQPVTLGLSGKHPASISKARHYTLQNKTSCHFAPDLDLVARQAGVRQAEAVCLFFLFSWNLGNLLDQALTCGNVNIKYLGIDLVEWLATFDCLYLDIYIHLFPTSCFCFFGHTSHLYGISTSPIHFLHTFSFF